MDSRIKTPKVERVLLHQNHRSREYLTGTLCLTDRHFIFIEPTGMKETWVLYHHVLSCERQSLTTRGYPVVIDTKTFQRLCLIIPRESDCVDIIETITTFAQPEKHEDLYAFQYKPNIDGFSRSRGWNVYDPIVEYGRMGVANNKKWKLSNLNVTYELCPTYSCILYVPNIDDSIITGSAKFRSKGRLPALSYYCKYKQSALCRCSQPLSYITRRSVEDEAMIQGIVDANPNSCFIYLIDTRPKLNAVVNKAAHKGGYESTENYPNIVYHFKDIHNIHVMRDSLQKVTEAVHSNGGVAGFLSALENSSWLKHIHLILEASSFIAKALYEEGVSVLVHCSDGWDRTAQTCALAALLIDPYYRTIHGFMILIEKEWLSFGHKFTIRSGHLHGDLKETSPIFTQFLDATWQVMEQFPTSFQFNELFLITLHDHLFSCQFGTFLGNNERERKMKGFSDVTYSLWGHMWARLEDFINPLYSEETQQQLYDEGAAILNPKTDIPYLQFWRGLYCRHESGPHPHELWQEVATSLRQQNSCFEDHIKFLQQHKTELEERLNQYKTTPDNTIADGACCSDSNRCETSSPSESKETSVNSRERSPSATSDDTVPLPEMNKDTKVPLTANHQQTTEHSENSQAQTNRTKENRATEMGQDHELKDNGITKTHETCPLPPPLNTSDDGMMYHKPKIHKVPTPSPGTPTTPSAPVVSSASSNNATPPDDLQTLLLHIPEMNLPWHRLRESTKCSCGVAFSFTQRKYHCSFCATVVCSVCGINHSQIPYMALPSQHRVCKTCCKLMSSRLEDESNATHVVT